MSRRSSYSEQQQPQLVWRQPNTFNGQHQRRLSRSHVPAAVKLPARTEPTVSEEDFPTPKANGLAALSTPAFAESCVTPFVQPDTRRLSASSCTTEIDDSTDTSDDDSEIVLLTCSNSLKKKVARQSAKASRPPSLHIPPPSAWPTIHKFNQQRKPGPKYLPPLVCPQTPLSPDNLKQIPGFLALPTQSATPSLTGSLTSDEATSMSCPSTPDLRVHNEREGEWDVPVQLNPEAMDTLLHISSDLDITQMESVIEVPEHETREMRERAFDLNLAITVPQDNINLDEDEIISAISIPSPGGFFASLGTSSQHVWIMPVADIAQAPTTSMATEFYGLPWTQEPDGVVEQVVQAFDPPEDGPPTARRVTLQESEVEVDEIDIALQDCEYDDEYENKLHKTATENMTRTSIWITAQETYLAALTDRNPVNKSEPPKQIETSTSGDQDANGTSPTKKAVRFVDSGPKSAATALPASAQTESLLYQAFQHLANEHSKSESVLQGSQRAEALQNQRLYLPELHRAELLHRFELAPMSSPKAYDGPSGPDDEALRQRRATIRQANRERSALQQVTSSFWNVQAYRLFHGGELVPKQIVNYINALQLQGSTPNILDLGGEPVANWGWAMAVELRQAKVYTAAVTSSALASSDWTNFKGPSNHGIVSVANTWTLPFPPGSFDVISARSLHMLLRTSAPAGSKSTDEYDATLAEIYRVLAPGGYLHFSLLDAEVGVPKMSALSTLSTEFAVALRTRGYDPCASRHFLARLQNASFEDVKRSWISLPLGGQEGKTAEAATGMLGAMEWERWMLRLQMEMGRPEARLLEGVAQALEETKRQVDQGTGPAGWNALVGCAQKPLDHESWL